MAEKLTKQQVLDLPVQIPELRNGDLFFCMGDALSSKLIQWFTDSTFSHCGIVWRPSNYDPPYLVEVAGTLFLEAVERYGVRVSQMSKYTVPVNGTLYDGPVVFARVPALVCPCTAIDFGITKLTDPYSLIDLVRIGLRILFGVGRGPSSHGWICSEFVAACLAASGIKITPSHGFVTPGDLWQSPYVQLLGRGA